MSAGSVSLESALRTCKVDTAWASRVESDRFFNPNNMVCPVWNGTDTTGRTVCPDSFYTKRGGCNSATDRVDVENDISRPKYMEYITLSANGIAGNIYGNTDQMQNSIDRKHELANLNYTTGNFGLQFGSNIQSTCGYNSYNKHDSFHAQGRANSSQGSQNTREAQSVGVYNNANRTRSCSGF